MKTKTTAAALAKTVLAVGGGLVFLAILVAVIAWMAGVFEEKISGEETALRPRELPEGAETARVVVRHKDYFEEAVGSLKAASRTEISSRILATINKILVTAGQLVKADQPLIELDGRDLELQKRQTQTQIEATQASLAKAQADFNRDRQLYEKKVISRADMDRSTTSLRVAQARMNQAKQEFTKADVLLSYTIIRAPRDGMIVDRWAEPGDTARPGVALLSLYDPASLRLEVPVMEKLAVHLKVGDPLAVHIDALNQDIQATIDEIVPQAEEASRSFLVKVRLPRLKGLREGMAGRLQIPAGSRDHLCLDTAAIEQVGQLQFVDVVVRDDTTGKRALEKRLIKTGRLGMPGHIEVLSGLKADEEVVLKSPTDASINSPSDQSPTPDKAGPE